MQKNYVLKNRSWSRLQEKVPGAGATPKQVGITIQSGSGAVPVPSICTRSCIIYYQHKLSVLSEAGRFFTFEVLNAWKFGENFCS